MFTKKNDPVVPKGNLLESNNKLQTIAARINKVIPSSLWADVDIPFIIIRYPRGETVMKLVFDRGGKLKKIVDEHDLLSNLRKKIGQLKL